MFLLWFVTLMGTQQLESLKLLEYASVYIGRVTDFFQPPWLLKVEATGCSEMSVMISVHGMVLEDSKWEPADFYSTSRRLSVCRPVMCQPDYLACIYETRTWDGERASKRTQKAVGITLSFRKSRRDMNVSPLHCTTGVPQTVYYCVSTGDYVASVVLSELVWMKVLCCHRVLVLAFKYPIRRCKGIRRGWKSLGPIFLCV
jgi:hypothetical protein